MMSVGWRRGKRQGPCYRGSGREHILCWRKRWPSIQYVEWKSTKENLNSRRSLREGNTFSARRSAGKSSRISRRNLWRQRLRVGLHPVEEGLSLARGPLFYWVGVLAPRGAQGYTGGAGVARIAGRTWRPPLHLRLAVS